MAAGTVDMAVEKPESVRIAGDLLRMARVVAAVEEVSLANLLGSILRPVLEKKIDEYERKGLGIKGRRPS